MFCRNTSIFFAIIAYYDDDIKSVNDFRFSSKTTNRIIITMKRFSFIKFISKVKLSTWLNIFRISFKLNKKGKLV